MPLKARIFVALSIAIGAAFVATAVYPWQPGDIWRFCFYLALSSLASGMKVNLPGIPTTMSVCFLFSLIGIAEMSLGETMVVSCISDRDSVSLESQTEAATRPGGLQRREYRHGYRRRLPVLPLAGHLCVWNHRSVPVGGGGAPVLRVEHGSDRGRHRIGGAQTAGKDLARHLLLDLSVLHTGFVGRLDHQPVQPAGTLAGLRAAAADHLLHPPFLSCVPGPPGRRKAPRRRDGRSAPAHH